MLAKGSWKIDPAQTLSGSLRYYNNDAQEPKNPQTTDASSSNPMTDRSTIQRDAQLGYRIAPRRKRLAKCRCKNLLVGSPY